MTVTFRFNKRQFKMSKANFRLIILTDYKKCCLIFQAQYGCQNGPGIGLTSFNSEVAVSLEKPDASTTGYKFYIRMATEDGIRIYS